VIVDKIDTEVVAMCAPGSGGDESASLVRHELYVSIHANNRPHPTKSCEPQYRLRRWRKRCGCEVLPILSVAI